MTLSEHAGKRERVRGKERGGGERKIYIYTHTYTCIRRGSGRCEMSGIECNKRGIKRKRGLGIVSWAKARRRGGRR